MNSLGIEYGSSSDEEDVAPPSPVAAPAASSSAVEAPLDTCKGDVNSNESPVQSSEDLTEFSETEVPVVTNQFDATTCNEAMLLRAGIPPAAPPIADDNETQQRIERFLRVQHDRGQDFQTTLQDKKEVRNPYILEKVVEYFGIDELQSNFSPGVFDPHGLPLHEFADALALEQKKRADVRAQRHLQQRGGANPRQLQFVAGNSSGM